MKQVHVNETDRHDITEILLKVALNTLNKQTNQSSINIISLRKTQLWVVS
jgi:hypothetical protein